MTGERDSVTIRPATHADRGLLAEIGAETFRDTFASENSPEDMASYLADAFSPERQAAELAEPGSWFLLAEIEGQVAGYARVKLGNLPDSADENAVRSIELSRLYARKHWLGRGVGAALITACMDVAREMSCERIWLGVWERNERAIRFYEKAGFAVVGEHIFQLGQDRQRDLLMARTIATADDAAKEQVK